jgi:hypothetical protein
MTKVDHRKIHMHLNYEVKELEDILGMNKKTIFRWIQSGLKTVEGGKNPILILGSELIQFIKSKNLKNNVKLDRSQFYCFKCRGPTHAERGSVEIHCDKKIGRCTVCKCKICRTNRPVKKDYNANSVPVQMSMFD